MVARLFVSRRSNRIISNNRAVFLWCGFASVGLVATLLDHTAALNVNMWLDQVIRRPLVESDRPSGNRMLECKIQATSACIFDPKLATALAGVSLVSLSVELDHLPHGVQRVRVREEGSLGADLFQCVFSIGICDH